MKNTKKFTVPWPARLDPRRLIHHQRPSALDSIGAVFQIGWDACELSHAGDTPPVPVPAAARTKALRVPRIALVDEDTLIWKAWNDEYLSKTRREE